MGQKVNPIGIRLGITRDWTSRWYAGKRQFPMHVHTDFRVREFLKQKLAEASVSRILIERAAKKVNITIQTARPGIVIGKKGEDIEKLRQETAALLGMPMSAAVSWRSFSMSSPFLPMTMPGRAVWMVMLTFLAARSMRMRLTEASASFRLRNSRTRKSVCTCIGNCLLPAYQREVQSRVIPSRIPIGLTF